MLPPCALLELSLTYLAHARTCALILRVFWTIKTVCGSAHLNVVKCILHSLQLMSWGAGGLQSSLSISSTAILPTLKLPSILVWSAHEISE